MLLIRYISWQKFLQMTKGYRTVVFQPCKIALSPTFTLEFTHRQAQIQTELCIPKLQGARHKTRNLMPTSPPPSSCKVEDITEGVGGWYGGGSIGTCKANTAATDSLKRLGSTWIPLLMSPLTLPGFPLHGTQYVYSIKLHL